LIRSIGPKLCDERLGSLPTLLIRPEGRDGLLRVTTAVLGELHINEDGAPRKSDGSAKDFAGRHARYVWHRIANDLSQLVHLLRSQLNFALSVVSNAMPDVCQGEHLGLRPVPENPQASGDRYPAREVQGLDVTRHLPVKLVG
jgi:hypothetical protein